MQNKESNRITIEYYTDPLCCWSWAFEPHLDKLLQKHSDFVDFRYFMGGLIPDWKSYNDPLNDISRAAQMGPLWLHVSKTTGMKVNTEIWHENPPVSSYPACIAVKCAQRQSESIGYAFQKKMKEAVMLQGQDISKSRIIFSLAEEFSLNESNFDSELFREDFRNGNGIEDFRNDLLLKEKNGITRLPGIILKNETGNGIVILGYRPYNLLEEIFFDFQNKSNKKAVK